MPPRRSHKKSKAGCQRCKNRKIKCTDVTKSDETHPTCGNCSKHGVECDFSNPDCITPPPAKSPPTLRKQSTSGTTTTQNVSSASSPADTGTLVPFYQQPSDVLRITTNAIDNRKLELRLMHHYTAVTANTFSNNQEQNMTWQVEIPAIAYEAPYLMDALLAVSALHLRASQPHDKVLVHASHGYMGSALSQYASLLSEGLNEKNAEALFSTSALIAFQASASRRFEDDQAQGYVLPLSWFHSFQGVKAMVMASWQWLRNSNRVFPIINAQPALALVHPDLDSYFAPLLEGMEEQIENMSNQEKAETRQAYEHAVAFLNWAHKKPDRNRILGFAATVSRRFIELIELYDPRALVIISCFFAMTKVVDDVWWLQGVAKHEVSGIYSIVPSDWHARMEWPLRVVNHEGQMDAETWGYNFTGRGMGSVEEEGSGVIDLKAHIDLLAEIMNNSVAPPPPD